MTMNDTALDERAVRKLQEAELEEHSTTEKPLSLDAVKERVTAILAEANE